MEFDRHADIDRGVAGDIARAYLFAISGDKSKQDRAMDIYHDRKKDCDSWWMRHILIQIPLLLQHEDTAQKQCEAWLDHRNEKEGIDDATFWEKEAIEFLAYRDPSTLDVESINPAERWFAHYQRGMLCIAAENWLDAEQHFLYCRNASYYRRAGLRRFWSRRLLAHLESKKVEVNAEEGTPRDGGGESKTQAN